jgi:hypothetical protein
LTNYGILQLTDVICTQDTFSWVTVGYSNQSGPLNKAIGVYRGNHINNYGNMMHSIIMVDNDSVVNAFSPQDLDRTRVLITSTVNGDIRFFIAYLNGPLVFYTPNQTKTFNEF